MHTDRQCCAGRRLAATFAPMAFATQEQRLCCVQIRWSGVTQRCHGANQPAEVRQPCTVVGWPFGRVKLATWHFYGVRWLMQYGSCAFLQIRGLLHCWCFARVCHRCFTKGRGSVWQRVAAGRRKQSLRALGVRPLDVLPRFTK